MNSPQSRRCLSQSAIDVKRGRCLHTKMTSALHVLLHPLQINLVTGLVLVARQIQPQLPGVAQQMLFFQVRRVGEKQVVHRPEFPLSACRLGSLGGHLGMRMHIAQRKMAKHKAQIGTEICYQRLHR